MRDCETDPMHPTAMRTLQTADGQTLSGLTELIPAQKSLFAALNLPLPAPTDLTKPLL